MNANEQGAGAEENSAANLDQVRDLLFGNQVRESEKRVSGLEKRLTQELADLRADTRKRLESLESFVKNEFQGLSKRLQDERAERGAELQRLGRDLADSVAQLGKRLEDLREDVVRSASELHAELLAQTKALSDDFGQRLGDQADAARAELRNLRHDSVDRSALSTLFAELALQLGDSGDPPE